MLTNRFSKTYFLDKTYQTLRVLAFLLFAYVLIFILYVANIPVASKITESKQAKYSILNQMMLREVDYQYLLKMRDLGIVPDRGVLKEYENYFQLVVDSVPNQADSYGMLGYCQYYLGKEDDAIKSFESAMQINPVYLNYYYNLAVIFYNKKDYVKAIALSQKALQLPLQLSAQSILISNRVYLLILQQMSQKDLGESLQEEQKKVFNLLQMSAEFLNNPAQSQEANRVLLEII